MTTPTIGPEAASVAEQTHVLRLACPGCQVELPIHVPRRAARITEWICESCGAAVTGALISECAKTLGCRVRFGPKMFGIGRSEPIPVSLRDLVAQFVVQRRLKQDNHERRRNPRVPCNLDAVVVGLDKFWLPCREPICAVVIDLAAHGLGMMTAQSLHDEHFAIQIETPGGTMQLLAKRAWSHFVGDCFQNTGVEFVARLGRAAVDGTALLA